MKHFDSTVTRLVLFQNDISSVNAVITRSLANAYTLMITLCDKNNITVNSHIGIHNDPITMRILQEDLNKMISVSGGLQEVHLNTIVAFQGQFNRTNPRKRISRLLKLLTNGLKRQYEQSNWYSRHKGNVVIELVRKNYIDLAKSVDEQDNDNAFIKLHVVVDKLGDYSFVLDYRFLVGENFVPGRVILKEKVKDIDDFVSLTRKGLLVAKQRGKLTANDVESFYKEIATFVMNNEFPIEEIVDRLNARLPI